MRCRPLPATARRASRACHNSRHSALCAGESLGMAERAVTREYAAKRLRCSMRTIERMLRDGRLAAVRREDGRLSVDPEDFQRVLADPGLLERRRASAAARAATSTDAPATGLPPSAPDRPHETTDAPQKADPALQARLTPLGGLVESWRLAPVATPNSPSAQGSRRPLAARGLVLALLVLACAAASLALIYFHSSVARRPVAAQVVRSADPHTAAAGQSPARGGRATPSRSSRATRGGASTSVVVRATLPQTRRPRVMPPPASSAHSRASVRAVETNCGFGSLAVAVC
jgi:excisionase family DNA binding protein